MMHGRRAEITSDEIASALKTLLVLALVFVIIFPALKYFLFDALESSTCKWELFLTSFGSSNNDVPQSCRMQVLFLSKANMTIKKPGYLTSDVVDARRGIKKWWDDSRYETTALYFRTNYKEAYDDNDPILYEYAMDKHIAGRMKRCWDKVDKGNIPLFDSWWDVIDWRVGSWGQDAPKKPVFGRNEQANADAAMEAWLITVKRPPVLCVICDQIKFDPELQTMFGERRIDSIDEWMRNTPITEDVLAQEGRVHSYYEYVTTQLGFFEPQYSFKVNEPHAIVYIRVPLWKPGLAHYVHNPNEWFDDLLIGAGTGLSAAFGNQLPEKVDEIRLMPYKEVSQRCTFVIS